MVVLPALAAPLAVWLHAAGMEEGTSSIAATGLVVIIITYVSIVIGELVPKRLAQFHPEAIARMVARPIRLLSLITRPFVHLLSLSTDTLLRLMGKRQQAMMSVTEEEIHALLEEGSEAGVIEQQEHEMVRNVFRLDERQLGSLMIPRADIVSLDIELPLEENLRIMLASEHSRFPVCRGSMDDVVGVVHAKQMLSLALAGSIIDLAALAKTDVFAGFWPGEKVLVVSNTTGNRLETYVIPGRKDSGIICMNGASAHLIKKGEEIIIMGFELTDNMIMPRNILVDKRNKFVRYL